MGSWIFGVIAVLVIGIGVVLYGALRDRRLNQQRAREVLSPPKRDIPGFDPETPAPAYLSELQARHRPEETESTELGRVAREALKLQLKDGATLSIKVGFASPDFITDDATGWAVLEQPRILVTSEEIESLREILPVLEKMALSHAAIVLVAPRIAEEVRTTLEVNVIQRRLSVIAVEADAELQPSILEAVGGTDVPKVDLRSGYLLPEHLGHCRWWVSSAKQSWIVLAE